MFKIRAFSQHPIRSLLSILVFLFLSAFQGSESKEVPVWVWILIILVILVLILWLTRRSAGREEPLPPRTEPVSTPAPSTPDDLTIIEGIGPKIAQVFNSAGINTFEQLAALDTEQMRTILDQGGIRLADPTSWAEQARLAAAGDEAALQALQDRLTAGRAE